MHLLISFSTFVFHLKEISILQKCLHFAAAPSILQIIKKKKNCSFSLEHILQNRINSPTEMHCLLPRYLCRAPKLCAQKAFHCTCAWLRNTLHYVGRDIIQSMY